MCEWNWREDAVEPGGSARNVAACSACLAANRRQASASAVRTVCSRGGLNTPPISGRCTYLGTTAGLLGLVVIQHFYPMPDVFPGRPEEIARAEFLTAVAVGLWLANLAVLWRSMTR
jgi:hypothetical protein